MFSETNEQASLKVEGEESPFIRPISADDYQASLPKRLMICMYNKWVLTSDSDIIANTRYLYISYLPSHFRNKADLDWNIRYACLTFGLNAYWVDFKCLSEEDDDKLEDLCKLGDVIRRASRTLIMIESELDDYSPRSLCWIEWGSRIWSLPELIFSRFLTWKTSDSDIHISESRHLCRLIYDWESQDAETKLIYLHSAKAPADSIPALSDIMMSLIEVIWGKRCSGRLTDSPVERVCALMAFLPRHTVLKNTSSEERALKTIVSKNNLLTNDTSFLLSDTSKVNSVDNLRVQVPYGFFIESPDKLYPEAVMGYSVEQQCWKFRLNASKHSFLAVSCRQSDALNSNDLEKTVQKLCKGLTTNAYWIDSCCMTGTGVGANNELYYMPDVYLRAKRTLIILPEADKKDVCGSAWKKWGESVWSIVAILLSSRLDYREADGSIIAISRKEALENAYGECCREINLINAVEPNKVPEPELWPYLVDAIWSKEGGISGTLRVENFDGSPPGPKFFPKIETERVFVLMAFMPVRIFPRLQEIERDALHRLLKANGIDILEFKSKVQRWCDIHIAKENHYPSICSLL